MPPKLDDINPPKKPRPLPVLVPADSASPKITKERRIVETTFAPEVTGESRSMLVIVMIYVVFYLSAVLLFWMLGGIAHRYTLSYPTLDQASDLTSVRNALVQTFGAVPITPDSAINTGPGFSGFTNLIDNTKQSVQNAEQAANTAAAAANTINTTANTINGAASKIH